MQDPHNDPYDYSDPITYTPFELWAFVAASYVIYLEVKYLYTWCQWFTNC